MGGSKVRNAVEGLLTSLEGVSGVDGADVEPNNSLRHYEADSATLCCDPVEAAYNCIVFQLIRGVPTKSRRTGAP